MPQTAAPSGRTVGSYVLGEEIAVGGQVDVYQGTHRDTGRKVAIKQLAVSPASPHYHTEVQRFQRTGRTRIGHRVVVDPIELWQECSDHYRAEPFIPGETLDVYCHLRGGRLPLDEALAITRNIGQGLMAMHRLGWIHRDVKPKNTIVMPNGEPRIFDLGISHRIGESTLTPGGIAIGTPPYMPPEQVTSPAMADQRADAYGLDMLLYFMLAGTTPFVNTPGQDAIAQVLHAAPRPLRAVVGGIPQHIDEAVLRCLAKKPEHRYPSVEAFIHALDGNAVANPGVLYCPSCAVAIANDSSFCGHCGAGLRTPPSTTARCLACGEEVGELQVCSGCKRTFPRGVGRLIFVSGALSGYRFRIPDGSYTVGRDTLLSRDQELSRRHVYVVCNQGRVTVADAGSANGTRVNNVRADAATLLQVGDELRLARSRCVFNSF